ncbi:hypothetical protein VIGAN_01280300, partial [Vigna angularis var. angularis]
GAAFFVKTTLHFENRNFLHCCVRKRSATLTQGLIVSVELNTPPSFILTLSSSVWCLRSFHLNSPFSFSFQLIVIHPKLRSLFQHLGSCLIGQILPQLLISPLIFRMPICTRARFR